MNKLFSFLLLMVVVCTADAQIHKPVQWKFEAHRIEGDEFELTFTATLEKGWHLYSQTMDQGGPMPTKFSFNNSDQYFLTGITKEISTVVRTYDSTFLMHVLWFEHQAIFKQRIKVVGASAVVKVHVEFMACRDEMCLPPADVEFAITVSNNGNEKLGKDKSLLAVPPPVISTSDERALSDTTKIAPQPVAPEMSRSSLWTLFISGLLSGLAALLMPCIFPMLPFTVAFFSKIENKTATLQALMYGLSIIVIYVGLGVLVTLLFGSGALNALSTNGIINIFLFVLLVIFALSFLGAFEFVMPHRLVNALDQRASKNSVIGLLFMAGTLSLVSFSCTGPIIGTLLVQVYLHNQSGFSLLAPVVGMFGFAIALAFPFTFLALFPSWIKRLPKAGSWMNVVKVSLGFLELALAFKFLSSVDLAYHWELLSRETFLAIWIIIFATLGLYLMGKIHLLDDKVLQRINPTRLVCGMATLAFTIYMIPGLWGAPLKSIAAFLPPLQTQDFDLYSPCLCKPQSNDNLTDGRRPENKFGNLFKAPFNINSFYDYDEGMAYAKKVNKPVILDFTGHACVNWRKMETNVWSHPLILERLENDFVVIQLYVDDKTTLSAEEQISNSDGKKITTVGAKWSDFQATVFGANAQPWYVQLGSDGRVLTAPRGADYNIENFNRFLEDGLSEFKKGS